MHDQASKLRQLVEQVHEAKSTTQVIAIASGKGGTGKSVLSVNLAIALRRLGRRVLLIDADFGLANVDLMLGATQGKSLAQVFSGEITAKEAIQEGAEGIRFLSGGSGVEAMFHMDEHTVGTMVANLLHLQSDTDTILLDIGAGVNATVLRLIMAAHETIVVTTPEPTAVMDAYALIKTIVAQSSKPPVLHLVVNRVVSAREAQETPDAITTLAYKNMNLIISSLGTIAHDPLVPIAIKRQVPILLSHPNAPASKDIQKIASKLLGTPVCKQSGGLQTFFMRLLPQYKQ